MHHAIRVFDCHRNDLPQVKEGATAEFAQSLIVGTSAFRENHDGREATLIFYYLSPFNQRIKHVAQLAFATSSRHVNGSDGVCDSSKHGHRLNKRAGQKGDVTNESSSYSLNVEATDVIGNYLGGASLWTNLTLIAFVVWTQVEAVIKLVLGQFVRFYCDANNQQHHEACALKTCLHNPSPRSCQVLRIRHCESQRSNANNIRYRLDKRAHIQSLRAKSKLTYVMIRAQIMTVKRRAKKRGSPKVIDPRSSLK